MAKEMKTDEMDKNQLFPRAVIIGLVGGLLLGVFLWIGFHFNFTEIAPKTYLLKPWVDAGWVDRFFGHVVAILITCVVSLIPTVIYYSLLQKINSMWVGVGYGILLWGILFFLLQPMIPRTRSMMELSADTWVTTICTFILYGLFVGYSISYDYHEKEIRLRKENEES